ncbi:MAG: hypothetical protein WBM07_13855 [Chitinivibrionales bacterium]
MKAIFKYGIVAFIVFSGIIGCESAIQSEGKTAVAPVAFMICGSNFAWGRYFNFTYYDTCGASYSYSLDSNLDKVSTLIGTDSITADGIAQLQKFCTKNTTSVSKDTIIRMRQLALNLDTGNHAEPLNCGADIGSINYCAYVYDRNHDWYSRVVLFQTGDVWLINLSPSADTICQWLVGPTYNTNPCNRQ